MTLRREIYQSGPGGSNTLAALLILDRDGAGNPRLTRERPPGNVVEQRPCNEQETADLLDYEADDLATTARTRLAAFDPAAATARQVAEAVADIIRVLSRRFE